MAVMVEQRQLDQDAVDLKERYHNTNHNHHGPFFGWKRRNATHPRQCTVTPLESEKTESPSRHGRSSGYTLCSLSDLHLFKHAEIGYAFLSDCRSRRLAIIVRSCAEQSVETVLNDDRSNTFRISQFLP